MSDSAALLAAMGTDGREWAREFCKRFRVQQPTPYGGGAQVMGDDDAEGLMIGWFANAIEAGRSAGMVPEESVIFAGDPPDLSLYAESELAVAGGAQHHARRSIPTTRPTPYRSRGGRWRPWRTGSRPTPDKYPRLLGTTDDGREVWIRHLRYLANEGVCSDCMEGDHDTCRHEGGYTDDEDNDQRCGCHLTGHALDNRPSATSGTPPA